jgi:superfamily II DNA or RNA helicase
MLSLRPYQNDAVQRIRGSFLEQKKAPLLVVPTGGGKTVIFSYIAASTSARGKRVLILVHRIELLRQTTKKLTEAGVYHGLINPNYTPNLHAPVQVASVQTLVNRLSKIQPPDLIVIDEAHHATAGTWKKIIDYFPNARVLGVTATPCRGDGTGLGTDAGGVFDDIVIGPQIQELIDAGYLVKPIIYAPRQRLDLSAVRTVRGDYDNKQVADIVDKPTITGDAVAHYRRLCSGTPAVVFCVSVNHAQHVAEEFRLAGYSAYSVDGSMDDDVRTRILNGLGNGTVHVVTSCDLISEGTDIPAIGCAILIRPTQSLGLYIQQVGRALRTSDGKSNAIILDHVGNVLTHGLPEQPREWSLEGEKRRKKKKGDEEPAIRVDQCPSCYSIHEPAPACPTCGHVKPIKDDIPKQVEGELVQLTAEQVKRQKVVEVAKAKTMEELEKIEKERGYKRGWAKHMFSAREKKSNNI